MPFSPDRRHRKRLLVRLLLLGTVVAIPAYFLLGTGVFHARDALRRWRDAREWAAVQPPFRDGPGVMAAVAVREAAIRNSVRTSAPITELQKPAGPWPAGGDLPPVPGPRFEELSIRFPLDFREPGRYGAWLTYVPPAGVRWRGHPLREKRKGLPFEITRSGAHTLQLRLCRGDAWGFFQSGGECRVRLLILREGTTQDLFGDLANPRRAQWRSDHGHVLDFDRLSRPAFDQEFAISVTVAPCDVLPESGCVSEIAMAGVI